MARHWLVLAVATLWAMAHGTRAEAAQAADRPPPTPSIMPHPRRISLFRLGLAWLRHQLAQGRLWARLWLAPEPWPQPPPKITITIHGEP